MTNYIALAIPFFFLGVFIEARVAKAKQVSVYRLGDALADMGCGVAQQLMSLFTTAGLIVVFAYLYEHHRFFTLPTWAAWVAAIVGVDFVYYWWHRLSHEVNFLWAAHGVHHQSEDYNLAVALRQSIFTSLTFFPFMLGLAFLGVPPLQIATVNAFSQLYQFWIHTELVPKLGPVEGLINTPSLHRVHHAINPRYLDRNHGATWMVWDRLFGTWQREDEQCVYGVTRQLGSYNPIWAQFEGFAYLLKLARHAPNPWEALKVFVKSPAWRAPWFPDAPLPPVTRREQQVKYDPKATGGQRAWAVTLFTLCVFATIGLLLLGRDLSLGVKLGAVGLVYLTLINIAGLLEGRPWVRRFEVARWIVTAGSALFVFFRNF